MKRILLLITSVLMMSLYAICVQAQGQYWLFHTTADNSKGNGGDKAVVGADLYKSVQKEKKFWDPVESTANNGQFDVFPYPEGERNDHLQDAEDNKYYKVAETFVYYQKIDNEWTVTQNRPSANSWEIAWVENDLGNMPEWQQNQMSYAIVYSNIVGYYHTTKQNVVEWQLEEYTDGNQQYQLIELYPEGQDVNTIPAATEQGKYCTIGGTTFTKTDGRWVSDTPAIVTGWDSTTGTLSVAPDETKTISELMTQYGITADDVNKIVFDGSEYDKATKTLTSSSNDYNTQATALTSADFEVDKIVLGEYVTIENGVTIFTVPNDNTTSVLGSNIDSNLLTDAEKAALKSANDLKLIGKITKADWDALNDKAGISPEGHTINSLDLSAAIINDGNSSQPFVLKNGGQFASVNRITLPNDPNYKYIPNDFATGTHISSINIPSQVEVIGKNAFHACASLKTVTWDQNGKLKDIQKDAFSDCNVSGDIVIPPSVEKIGDYAFANASHISSVTFPKGSKLSKFYGADNGIGDHAFWMNTNNDLKNVYVLEDEHLLACHHDAFDYDNTDGQTVMSTVKTRLHYPPSLYYYYVGEWKSRVNEGKVEGQEDLLALRKCVDEGSGTFKRRWVDENNQYHEQMITINLTEEELQWVNGFQKFVSSGIPVTFDTQWRTYSDVVNIKVPAGGESNGVKVADVYIVCGYESGKVILKKMVKDDIIPAHTGILIRHYVTDQANGGVLNFPHVTNEEAATLTGDWDKPYRFVRDGDSRMTYHADAHEFSTGISTRKYFPTGEDLSGSDYEDGYPNYLEFLDCKGKTRIIYNAENDNIIDWPTLEMEPYKGQKVTYRNFVFGNGKLIQHAKEVYQQYGDDPVGNPEKYGDYTGADWDPTVQGQMGWGFFRCISRDYKVNSKAFLHYPAEVFKNPKGGSPEAIVDGEVISGAKPMELQFFEDEGPFIYEFVEGGIATSIRQIDDAEQQDYDYYTIQGVKVKKPSQNGIYIHNGKKIVVK